MDKTIPWWLKNGKRFKKEITMNGGYRSYIYDGTESMTYNEVVDKLNDLTEDNEKLKKLIDELEHLSNMKIKDIIDKYKE